MPTVPYGSQQRVTPDPLPNARLNPSTQGAFAPRPVGPDLSGVTQVATQQMRIEQRIRMEEKLKADQIATTHAYSALTTGTNDILHGPDGVLNRQGQDAFTADQDAYDRYGKHVADIRETLGNDDQKAIFDKMVLNEWSAVDNQVQSHIARQRKVYDAQGTDALVTAKRNEAIQSSSNPEIVDASIAVQQAAIADHLKRNGAPPEEIKNATAQAASTTRLGVLETLLNSEKDLMAAAYFDKYRGEFVGKDLQQAERLTQAGSIRGESQRQADAIVKRAPTLSDAITAAQSIEEPRVRDETEQRIRRHFADVAADQRQERQQAFEQAGAILEKTGDFDKIPLATRMKLTPEENGALQRREDQIRHPKTRTDWETYNSLMNMTAISDVTREQFAHTNLMQYRDKLGDTEFKQLLNIQRSMGTKGAKPDDAALKRAVTRAETDAHFYRRKAEAAAISGDKEAQATYERYATEADLEVVRANDALHGRDLHIDVTGTPTTPAQSATPPSGNIDLRTPAGASPTTAKTPPTPQMLEDIARKGPRYAQYLRSMGIDAPLTVPQPAAPAPKPEKKPKSLSVIRDASGRITTIKPE